MTAEAKRQSQDELNMPKKDPVVQNIVKPNQNHHEDGPTSMFLPRPWKKHRHDIMQQRNKKHLSVDDQDKNVEFSEHDGRLKTVPFGCLSFHILELSNVSISNSTFESSAPLFYYCVIHVGRFRRVTKCVQSISPRLVRIDSVVLFSCELSEWRANYRNKLKIEYWTFQDPAKHYIIGTAQLHYYNFIHHIHGIESHYIWGDGLLRGKMIYEYTFSYGAFGYGHSNQFRNTDIPIFETVSHSLFPRIRLEGDDVVESRFNTVLPSKLKIMTKNSFVLEKPRRESQAGESSNRRRHSKLTPPVPKSVRLHQVEFKSGHPVHCKIHMPIYQREIEADFNETYGDYLCITKRSERIQFCKRLVEGRRQDIREREFVSNLFQQIPKDSIESVLEAPEAPDSMDYPTNAECTYGHRTIVYDEDEEFFETFPSTDRSSGYIGRLFGFTEHKPEDVRQDFPLQELQRKRKKHKSQVTLSLWTRYVWSRLGACLTWLRFLIIPADQAQRHGPEISVTLPSPEVSTTDLCVLWVDPEPHKAMLSEEHILKQESHRFGLPEIDEPPQFPEEEQVQVEQGEASVKDDKNENDVNTEVKEKQRDNKGTVKKRAKNEEQAKGNQKNKTDDQQMNAIKPKK